MEILNQLIKPWLLLLVLALAYSVMLTGTDSGITRKLAHWIIFFMLFIWACLMFIPHH